MPTDRLMFHVGLGLCTSLVIVFGVLKLTHHLAWSWWWVFSPWLIPATVIGILVALILLLTWLDEKRDR